MTGARWTKEQDRVLRQLASDGFSGGLIAPKVKKTRNAVVGRAFRLGLQLRGEFRVTPSGPRRKPRKRSVTLATLRECEMPTGETGVGIGHQTPFEKQPSILTVRTGQCKFPMWPDKGPIPGDARLCGSKTKDGSPYCKKHSDICYGVSADEA